MKLTSSVLSTDRANRLSGLFADLRSVKADAERGAQLRSIARLTSSVYVLPLFLIFSIADYLFYRPFAFEFLFYRLSTIAIIVLLGRAIEHTKQLRSAQLLCSLYIAGCAAPIHLMILRLNEPGTPYFAGLILVALGMTMGFRFTGGFYLMNLGTITLPFVAIVATHPLVTSTSLLSIMFLVSVLLIATVSRFFNEDLHRREHLGRGALEQELATRDRIIERKSLEAINIAALAKQFSPQVVKAVSEGSLNLAKDVRRAEICVVFFDIVGSTERFVRLDREDLHRVLSMFMEDVMDSLLKFDITIDKFLGDGVIGFSNDPLPQADFIERGIRASLLVQSRIEARRRIYEDLWLAPFQIGIGISSGYASVGFYGNERHIRSYTAIGRVVNLASRLGSSAQAGQVLISHECVSRLEKTSSNLLSEVAFEELGSMKLKGFEGDRIRTFAIAPKATSASNPIDRVHPLCPLSHGKLDLDVNDRGIFLYRCSQCDFELSNLEQLRSKKQKAA
jgi:adenylate cyclase